MAKTVVTCQYCGHSWLERPYFSTDQCPRCRDTDLKRRTVESMDAFGYDVPDPNKRKRRST